jgi:hypothetical protein
MVVVVITLLNAKVSNRRRKRKPERQCFALNAAILLVHVADVGDHHWSKEASEGSAKLQAGAENAIGTARAFQEVTIIDFVESLFTFYFAMLRSWGQRQVKARA